MNLILYYAPLTCALVPYVMLTEAGASFEVHAVDSRAGGTRTTEFLKVNPKHKVPVLVTDGEPLTENIAIQMWIARQFPGIATPADGERRNSRPVVDVVVRLELERAPCAVCTSAAIL